MMSSNSDFQMCLLGAFQFLDFQTFPGLSLAKPMLFGFFVCLFVCSLVWLVGFVFGLVWFPFY